MNFRPALVFVTTCTVLILTRVFADEPIARHMAIVVSKNQEVVITLLGYDTDGEALSATITELPESGYLYQLSSTYNKYGYEPKLGTKVTSSNVLVTGKNNRIIYNPPSNTNPPTGIWAQFKYTINHDGSSTKSKDGIVSLVSDTNILVGSNFNSNSDEWTVVNNGDVTDVKFEASSRGSLNHYIWSRENEINIDPVKDTDKNAWMFQAPSKFLGNQAIAYGGSLNFWIGSSSGDFSAKFKNSNDDLVEIKCDSCASHTGIRLVRRLSAGTLFDGSTKHMCIPLIESGWLKDSKNSLVPFTAPTVCEMAEVLEGVTSIRILGDFTKWYETIGIDNVFLKHGPGIPIQCYEVFS